MQFKIIPLDERILFDAAALVDIVQHANTDSQDHTAADTQTKSQESSQQETTIHKDADASDQAVTDTSHQEHQNAASHDDTSISLAATATPQQDPADGVRVLVVSSDIHDAGGLTDAALNGVKVVYYDSKTTTPDMLAQKIADVLGGEKADSIAFAGFGKDDGFVLTQDKTVTAESMQNDPSLKEFWHDVGTMINDNGRIDLLSCNLAATDKGLQLIAQIDQVADSDVGASTNLTGSAPAGGDWTLEYGGVDVAKTYFSVDKLATWNQVLDNTVFQVKDIQTGVGSSSPDHLVDVNGTLYFVANDGTNGVELWRSDGLTSGTVLVKDINVLGSSSPDHLTNVGGVLYFTANDGVNGIELWKSDGTAAGTVLVKDIVSGSGSSSAASFSNFNGILLFSANDGTNGTELWRSDGTAAGTYMLKDINTGSGSASPSSFVTIGTKSFFTATNVAAGSELWVTDGTAAGTVLVKDIKSGTGGSSPGNLTNFNGTLLFTADDGSTGTELWRSDGTSGGTVLVKDIRSGNPSSNIAGITVMGNQVFFSARDNANGTELWISDGTTAGTNMVKDINPSSGNSTPSNFAVLNNVLYFNATVSGSDNELWRSDGTAAGTYLAKDIQAGSTGSDPQSLVVYNGKLYFSAATSIEGRELFVSDGTAAGTTLVKDIFLGSSGSSPSSLTVSGDKLYMTANDGSTGVELWAFTDANASPINTIPGSQTTGVNTSLTFNAANSNLISVSDVDAGSASLQITLTAANGTMSLSGTTGLTFTTGTGTNNSSMVFTGTLANINNALNNLTFNPTSNFLGSASITLTTNDQGNTGSGGAKSDTDMIAITVSPVNNPPVNSVPGAQSIAEDATITFNTVNSNLISVSDSDAGSGQLQVTLTSSNGTMSLSGVSGLIFTSGSGTNSANMVLTGTIANINAALNGMTFTPTSNYTGSAVISLTTNDQGNTGFGGAKSDTDTIPITITAVNDAPVNTVPATQTVNEDTTLTFNAANSNLISVSDVDAGSGNLQITLTATNGTMSLSGTSGLTFTTGTGTNNGAMVFTGTAASVNAALNGLTFAPAANFNGPASISLTTNDQGNTGSGGAQSDTDTIPITITAVNDATVNAVPAAQTTAEDTALTFNNANSNLISVSDIDSGTLQITLTSTNGTISLSGTSGLIFTTGTGSNDSTMVFTGTAADLNAALDGLTFSPNANYNGPAVISLTTNDQGNSGSGGALSDTDTIPITITAVNDAPVNTVPAAQTTAEDTALIFNSANSNLVSISDVDAGTLQITLTSTNGTISLSGISGLTFTTGTGTNDSTMVFTGSIADINAALDGLTFLPNVNYNGSAVISLTTNDQGAPAGSETSIISIDITPVNDPPGNHLPATVDINDGQPLTFSADHGNQIWVSDVDSPILRIELTAVNGTISLGGTTGITFISGGNGTSSLIFVGSVDDINAALNGLLFTPSANGEAKLSMTTNDAPDGTGISDADEIVIHVAGKTDPVTQPTEQPAGVFVNIDNEQFSPQQILEKPAYSVQAGLGVFDKATKKDPADKDLEHQSYYVKDSGGQDQSIVEKAPAAQKNQPQNDLPLIAKQNIVPEAKPSTTDAPTDQRLVAAPIVAITDLVQGNIIHDAAKPPIVTKTAAIPIETDPHVLLKDDPVETSTAYTVGAFAMESDFNDVADENPTLSGDKEKSDHMDAVKKALENLNDLF